MNLELLITGLRTHLEANDFQGYDPYDALNSPVLKAISSKGKTLRMAFIQALKRIPVNIRPLLGIKKGCNPKGLGLILWGYARLFAIDNNPEYLDRVDLLLGQLEQLKSKKSTGNGWGYNFDWQSRAFFVPKFTPTIVNSAFIGHALIDVHSMTGNERAFNMALPIADFILKDLNRLEKKDSFCFSYTPIDHYFVHNANLLGASLLIRLYKFNKKSELKEAALNALRYSMGHQHPDGFWFYAEKESSHWIDSFHTGFNLQAIKYFFDEGYALEYKAAFGRGVAFYQDNFFLSDGTPKYYHDRTYPIDIHSSAQALAFFGMLGSDYRELVEKLLAWTISRMKDQDGSFYFQKHRHSTNKIRYMRWSQAWMFHALTSVLMSQRKKNGK